MTPLAVLAATATTVAVAIAVQTIVRPTPRLGARVRPYTATSRSRLGAAPDLFGLRAIGAPVDAATGLRRAMAAVARRLGRATDGGADEVLAWRLRQAGLLPDVPADERVHAYRLRQLGATMRAAVAFGGVGLLAGRGALVAIVGTALGAVYGASRGRAVVDRAIADRRAVMRAELSTVNQLLAMCIRAGGGVGNAIGHVVGRGQGAVVDELREVLAAHRSGRPIAAALEHAASTTPEPQAARTYRLLATGVQLGADLAVGLRALSDDVRDRRVEELKRAATKRRAAMLVPIIVILAPVMLLFVAAPLPSIVFGGPPGP